MTGNLRIIYPNSADDAVLTASPAMVATLPPANLQDSLRENVARSNSVLADQHLLGDFNQVAPVSAMALLRHNLTSAATIRLKVYEGLGQTGTLLYDSGVVSAGNPKAWGDFVWGVDAWGGDAFTGWPVAFSVLWFDPVYALSFDLEIDDAANADGYIEAARLFLGLAWEPAYNFEWGISMTWVDPSTQETTDGGSLRTDEVESRRRLELSLEWLSASERAQLANIVRRAGKKKDVFVSCYPEAGGEQERDHAGAFKFVQDVPLTHKFSATYAAPTIVLEEA